MLQWIQRHIARSIDEGTEPRLIQNRSSSIHLQGPFFVEPLDSQEVSEAKHRRLGSSAVIDWVRSLTPDQFESLCTRVLALIGARHYVKTKRSKDQGIDFYGKLVLADLSPTELPFLKFQRDMEVWIIGQAKHYPAGSVSAPEVRELVGSVQLARAKAYATSDSIFPDLKPRVTDPLVALFLTTGSFTRDALLLGKSSGVILKTGVDIANLLADEAIGFSGEPPSFVPADAVAWLITAA